MNVSYTDFDSCHYTDRFFNFCLLSFLVAAANVTANICQYNEKNHLMEGVHPVL